MCSMRKESGLRLSRYKFYRPQIKACKNINFLYLGKHCITFYSLLDKHPRLREFFYKQLPFIKCIFYKRHWPSPAPSRLLTISDANKLPRPCMILSNGPRHAQSRVSTNRDSDLK